MSVLDVAVAEGRATLTLSRPEIHNAINDKLIDALLSAVKDAAARDDVRYVVIAGAGKSFCAGADLNWMKAMVDASVEDNKKDVARLADLFDLMVACPKPVIARVHGAALGGGMGLVSACDLVAAAPRALFGLTEVRLGLVPAVIFPYLARKVAPHELLSTALTGERFRADRALSMGLVNEVDEDVDAVIARWGEAFLQSGPEALGKVKRLFAEVPRLDAAAARELTTDMIARVRVGAEGQEGMRAFLEQREPSWRGV
ncbi:MAG: enoyl-CoA hydratase/isomerase family protein [Myxococcales bacterium]|nr:enoyl-CoA hydratase/isomerase family protein [Myxococcales bacterium]